MNTDFLRYRVRHVPFPGRIRELAAAEPGWAVFQYRQSPRPLLPPRPDGLVQTLDPPFEVSGMVSVTLDARGKLLAFRAVPPQVDEAKGQGPEPDWGSLFSEAGMDIETFTPAAPVWLPPGPFDARGGWKGRLPGGGDEVQIVAASYRGKPVYFEVVAGVRLQGLARREADVRRQARRMNLGPGSDWRDNSRQQPEPPDPAGEFLVIERGHALAVAIAGMVKRIGHVKSGFAAGQRLRERFAVLDRDMRQAQQVVKDPSDLLRSEPIVAAHDPFQLQHHRLAYHQWLSGLDQAASRFTLPPSLGVRPVRNVVAGKHIGVEADHGFSRLAGSKSGGTAPFRLVSMPNPVAGISAGELRTRSST